MTLAAGRLRHRLILQAQVETQSQTTGANSIVWENIATLWAAIEPLSAREFIASQAETSKVVARITIRYRQDINAKMRFYHAAKNAYYNIEGVLADKESGLEYLTLPVSEGVRWQEGEPNAVLPVNLVLPVISGNPADGELLTASTGLWANDPVSFTYQWYNNDLPIMGAINQTWIIDALPNDIITVGVVAINSASNSLEAISNGALIN